MPLSSTIRFEFDDFCALQEIRVRQQLDRRVQIALTRQADARKAQHQALCDGDLDAQPFAWGSALGPRARNLSEIEGDES